MILQIPLTHVLKEGNEFGSLLWVSHGSAFKLTLKLLLAAAAAALIRSLQITAANQALKPPHIHTHRQHKNESGREGESRCSTFLASANFVNSKFLIELFKCCG